MNYFYSKTLLLQLFGQLGEVPGVFLGSLHHLFLGRSFGNLIHLLGHFTLGSVQLRRQTLVFLP